MRASARKANKAAGQKGAVRRGGNAKKGTGKGAAGKQVKGAKAARQKLGRAVAEELLKLRPVLREIGTTLLDRLEGELAGLALSLDGGEGLAGETPTLPRPIVLSKMLADIQTLKVKPGKGRVKDLRRLEALLEILSARIPPMDGMRVEGRESDEGAPGR